MNIKDISIPEVYQDSYDFRMLVELISKNIELLQYNIENLDNIYDPQSCPSQIMPSLCDTIGYEYNDTFTTSYNRLVLMYFIDMIRLRGSLRGLTLAAALNLAQFKILDESVTGYDSDTGFVKPKAILKDRLSSNQYPVNASHVDIDEQNDVINIVYYSERYPEDACLKYVRPAGMYIHSTCGVNVSVEDGISVDARLTTSEDAAQQSDISPIMTRVAEYSRQDYASLENNIVTRKTSNYRNSRVEAPLYTVDADVISSNKVYTIDEDILLHSEDSDSYIAATLDVRSYQNVAISTTTGASRPCIIVADADGNIYDSQFDGSNVQTLLNYIYRIPKGGTKLIVQSNTSEMPSVKYVISSGQRSLSSLQLCNNDDVVRSLIPSAVFMIGYGPQAVQRAQPLYSDYMNLIYDSDADLDNVSSLDDSRTSTPTSPKPAVGHIMGTVGDAIWLNDDNSKHSFVDSDNNITSVDD